MYELKNLIPLEEEKLKEHHIPIKVTTLYKWRTQNKYNFWVKIGKKRVFVNLEAFKDKFIKNF